MAASCMFSWQLRQFEAFSYVWKLFVRRILMNSLASFREKAYLPFWTTLTNGLVGNWLKKAYKVAVMFELSQLFHIYSCINKILTYWECTGEHGSQLFVPSLLTSNTLACLIYVIMFEHLNKTSGTFFFLLVIFILCDICTTNITISLLWPLQ